MPHGIASLLAGRRTSALNPDDIRRALNTFLGLDTNVIVRHDEGVRTVFRVSRDEAGEEYGEIVFGPDIYPGLSVVDPNSALGLKAAAAHELTHYYRWWDKRELPQGPLNHLDEALTSLEAIARYEAHLSHQDIRQLVSDAIQRIVMHIESQDPADGT